MFRPLCLDSRLNAHDRCTRTSNGIGYRLTNFCPQPGWALPPAELDSINSSSVTSRERATGTSPVPVSQSVSQFYTHPCIDRARKPQTQRTVPVRRRRPAREPATYFQLNVLHYSSGETVLAKAWVRKMRSREPEVRIDIDAMNLIANIQAQTYYSNAIEAHLLNKPHPGLRTEPTPTRTV